jgi:membrane protease YdiL (CAAX protease family)
MLQLAANALALGILAASLLVWARLASKLTQHETLVLREPRAAVPWSGWDVAFLVLCWLASDLGAAAVANRFESAAVPAPPVTENAADTPAPHPVLLLIQAAPNGLTLAVCLLTAVVLAPLVEEFLFRLLLQGWLERNELARQSEVDGETPLPRAALPLSLWLPAAIFALFHARSGGEIAPPEQIIRFLLASAVSRGGLLLFGIAWLKLRPNQSTTIGSSPASWRDLGIVPEKFGSDVRLGLAGLAAVIVPVLGLQALLNHLLADTQIAPDPVPLFFLALVLGYLYRQTHRIVPAVVLHAGLNATTLAAAWLTTLGGK